MKAKRATFVSKSGELMPIDLGAIGERYVHGESLEVLADEVGLSDAMLRRYLNDAGLLVPESNSGEGSEASDAVEFVEVKGPLEEQSGRRPGAHLSRAAQRTLILKDIPHDEVIRRYRDDSESLGSILYDLRMRGVYVTEYFLKEVLAVHGVPLRNR